ncbi:MAG: hypothetical protein ACMXYK_01900 [Candidatus Woesearchaeota archaeon]
MKKRRGQLSPEFLVITAIIIIILIILLNTLVEVPPILTNIDTGTTRHYWENTPVGILDYSYNETQGSLILRNNQRFPINITKITLDEITESPGILVSSKQIATINTTKIGVINQVTITYQDISTQNIHTFEGAKPLGR